MSALDKVITHTDPPKNDEGWIEFGLMLLWSESNGHEYVADNASEELATLRDNKLKLEIAARDFLRACEMRGQLLPSEFSEAHDTLAAMVNKGDE